MARVFTPDITHSLISEATFGVTPTATATRYELPLSQDQNLLVAEATAIKSNTKRPGRAGNGSQRGMTMVSGSLNMRGFYGPVVNALLESALSASFTSKVAKAGSTDKSFSVLSKLAADQIKVYAGCMARGFTIDAKANGEVNFDFDVMGLGQTLLTTDNALTVTTTTLIAPGEFEGSDVTNINVAGQTVSFSELSFQTSLDRTQSPVLGSNIGIAFGVNGVRESKITIKAYRDSFVLENALTGNAQAFSFDVGITGSGYRVSCPAMYFDVPKDELNNGSAFITITGTAGYDNTAATDLVVTQL